MGIFDRIGNLGKGMLGIIKSEGPTAKDRTVAELDSELERRRANQAERLSQPARDRASARKKASSGDVLDKLKGLHESGLLTDEEYAEKVAAASGLMGPLPSSAEASDDPDEDHAVETETVELDGGIKKSL
jgi:hypothetical protein